MLEMREMLHLKAKTEAVVALARVFHLANPKTPISVSIADKHEDFTEDLFVFGVKKLLKKYPKAKIAVFIPFGVRLAWEFGSAEDKARVVPFLLPLLEDFVRQGVKPGPAFARLARTHTRSAKNANADVFLFASGLLHVNKYQKTIKQVIGKQKKCFFLADFFGEFVDYNQKYFLVKNEPFEGLLQIEHDQSVSEQTIERLWAQKLSKNAYNRKKERKRIEVILNLHCCQKLVKCSDG